MPECFEKSLIRICYLLHLLQNDLPTGGKNADNGDHILQIKSKDEVLKYLENDINLIKCQKEEAKIDDPSIN